MVLPDPVLVLAVHGIRGQAGAATLHGSQLLATGQALELRIACHKGVPDLQTVLRDLAGRDVVLAPMLMADGFTCKRIRERAERARPALRSLILLPPIGLHPALPELALAVALSACKARRWRPAGTGLLLAAHGTRRDPASGDGAARLAEHIRRRARFAEVGVGFLDQAPAIDTAAAGMAADRIVTIGLFMDAGEHGADDVPALLAKVDRATAYTGPIGLDPGMTALLLGTLQPRVLTPID